MPEKQESFLEKIARIRKEDEEKKQAQAQKEELERDSDGDGIPDIVERNQGTNPYSPDTDGDGKSDQEEVSFGSNPLEADTTKKQQEVAYVYAQMRAGGEVLPYEGLTSKEHADMQVKGFIEQGSIAFSSPKKLTKAEIAEQVEIFLNQKETKSVAELIETKDSKRLSQVLKEGVKNYFQSDTYKQYLETMSKFHNYSPRNIQMILMQNPEASHVASFKKWKDEFERSVNKGEKALRIFAPIMLKKKDPKTNEPILDENGKEQTYTSFKLVPVFDVSQTSGKELAKAVYELEGTYEDYGNLYQDKKKPSSRVLKKSAEALFFSLKT